MSEKLDRRQLLKLLALATGTSAVAYAKLNSYLKTKAQYIGTDVFLPFITSNNPPTATPTSTATATPTSTSTATATPTPTATATGTPSTPPPTPTADPRVVHVHNPNVANWNSGSDYWNYIDQVEIDSMVDQGMLWLTGEATLADAWGVVLPNYQAGQKIAIKVSFNNTDQDNDCGNINNGAIDGVIEPVNAVIRGLKTIGVQENDIHIYETIRNLPYRFVNGCDFTNIQFFDRGGCGNQTNTFDSNDSNAVVQFNPPAGDPAPPTLKINDVLINADYLINIPIMKIHGMAGWSLAMKNHYGTTQKPGGLHYWSSLGSPYYTPDYSPIVDIYLNTHVRDKTVLTIGDGIFGAFQHTAPPSKWTTFGNDYPKSLFFSFDPVAIDCVMGDLLAIERDGATFPGEHADDHLVIAQNYGLGTYERGDPWASPPQQWLQSN